MSSHHTTLVTGGTGFLGRHIVGRLLDQGRRVVVLSRTPSRELLSRGALFRETSLEDAEAVMAACEGVETVYHVAAKVGVWGAYEDYFKTNVLGTRALLAGCKKHGVKRLIHTSTPSVVYNGQSLCGVDERLPLTRKCPSPYPLTKAIAEAEVLAANSAELKTVALRPHLIWGPGDPHLVPRVLERARTGRLRIVGNGRNLVDMVHVQNATDAHLLAELALACPGRAEGKAYFITNGEPVVLWDWINGLLGALGEPLIKKHIPLSAALVAGALCESVWKLFSIKGEPPMTRFVASELAKDHWFSLDAARQDLCYTPRISMEAGTEEIIHILRKKPVS